MNKSIKRIMKVLLLSNILMISSICTHTVYAFNFTTDKDKLSDTSTWYLDTCYKEAEKVEDERHKLRELRKKLLETTLAKYQPSEKMVTSNIDLSGGDKKEDNSEGATGTIFNTPTTELDKLMSPTAQQCTTDNFNNKKYVTDSVKCAKDAVPATVKNMTKYSYKDILKSTCKAHGVDPYLLLSLIAIESNGDPTNRTGSYWGLCQVDKNRYKNLTDPKSNIEAGCLHLAETAKYLGSKSAPYVLIAYNSGAGACKNAFNYACKKKNIKGTMETVPIGKVMEDMGEHIHNSFGWSRSEKTEYYMKCGYAYELLKKQNALG